MTRPTLRQLRRLIPAIVSLVLFASCSQDPATLNDPPDPTDPPVVTGRPDSSFYLTSIFGDVLPYVFLYDSSQRINEVYVQSYFWSEYRQKVYYGPGNRISHIVGARYGLGYASMIPRYNANGKIEKVVYRANPPGAFTPEDPYWASSADPGLYPVYDSIAYDQQNRIKDIFYKEIEYQTLLHKTRRHYKFLYENPADSNCSRLELSTFDQDQVETPYDALSVSSLNIENPMYKHFPIFGFLARFTALFNGSFDFSLTYILNHPSTLLGYQLVFLPNMISYYSVDNTWGQSNFQNVEMRFGYMYDSTLFVGHAYSDEEELRFRFEKWKNK